MQINSNKFVPISRNSRLNVVFFGTPQFVIPVLEKLIQHFTVVGIVTTPDEKTGRKQLLTPTPVKKFAQTHKIPIHQPNTLLEIRNLKFEIPVDLFVVAAYGKIIPDEVINLPRLGSINIHPSRLPDYRGPSPLQEIILSGDTETAVTIMQMDADVDHGPILQVKSLAISPDDTFLSLAEKAFKLGAEMLPETIEKLENQTITFQDQDHSKATFTNHITKDDGYFDINNPPTPQQLDRMIRAFFPWPTAWTKIGINLASRQAGNHESKIMKFLPGNKVQIEGGKPMHLNDFFNGYPDLKDRVKKLFND